MANTQFRVKHGLDVTGNVTLSTTTSLTANGSVGTAGQVLASNGSAVYWSTQIGYTGSAGTNGYAGSSGTDGYTGSQGLIGYTGSAGGGGGGGGYTGSAGYDGSSGYTGSIGYTGSTGIGLVTYSNATYGSTLSWNSNNYNIYIATAQNANLTISADAGNPEEGKRALFRIKDDGTPRNITWANGVSKGFRNAIGTLPFITAANKTLYVGAIYNSTDSRWDIIATSQEI